MSAQEQTFTVDPEIVDAVSFCVLGGDDVSSEAAFERARDLGLIYTNLNKATPQGEGLIVALGWLGGERRSFPSPPVLQEETGTRELSDRDLRAAWAKAVGAHGDVSMPTYGTLRRFLAAALPSGDGERMAPRPPATTDELTRNPTGPLAGVTNALGLLLAEVAANLGAEADLQERAVFAVNWWEQVTGERHDFHDVICDDVPYEEGEANRVDCEHGAGRLGGLCGRCLAPVAPDEAYPSAAAPPAGETGDGREDRCNACGVSKQQVLRKHDEVAELVRRAAPFVNAVAAMAKDKGPALTWLADAAGRFDSGIPAEGARARA